jgi:predicted hydrocarbon binding protein
MTEDFDFEKYWLAKFSASLTEKVGEEVKNDIIEGSENFSENTSIEEIFGWSQKAMEKLDALFDEEKRINIMTGCACQYPKEELQEIKKKYEETKDIGLVHQMLQEKFEKFLKDTLNLNDKYFNFIVSRGWGLAGVRNKKSIIATKIPKSGYITDYMEEKDPEKKKAYYCHCPRVRDILKRPGARISLTYCYCGAGFYKGIWEEILQKKIRVEVLESVLNGGDECKIKIHLPSDK